MSIQESTATALVRFTGLGIICFNPNPQRGEIAAIRDNKHLLSVRIQKPVFQEGSGIDAVAYEDIATYQQLPTDDVKIEIKAQGEPAIDGFEIYKPGDFDRLGSADVNDFRWILNMNTLHDKTILNPNTETRYPIARIYVGNGLFYTQKLDRNLLFEKIEKDANGTPANREILGNVAETIGVKIEGEAVSVTVRIGGQEETHLLQRVAGLPFRIEIKNMDYSDNAVYSDMADYYRYLSSPQGNQVDLAPIIEGGDETAEGGSVNHIEFCHPIGSDDLQSIDNL